MKLLVFAHIPPPHHGQSYMVKLMLDHLGGDARSNRPPCTDNRQPSGANRVERDGLPQAARRAAPEGAGKQTANGSPQGEGGSPNQSIECYHVNARYSDNLEDIGSFRFEKAWLVLRYCLEAIWCRFRYNVHAFYYVPAPGKRAALYRDWIVMLLCRPFFRDFIHHWHAVGLGDWLRREGNWFERWFTPYLLGKPALGLALAIPSMRDALWFETRRVELVPNGIPDPCPDFDSAVLPRRRARLIARRELLAGNKVSPSDAGPEPDCFRVLYLAHCTREKGLFDTLDGIALAAARLRADHSPLRLHLTVAGLFPSDLDETAFRERAASEDVAGCLTYAGFVAGAEKARLLAECDALCFPTYYHAESFGLVVIEAMAAGMAIITTRWRAIPELLPADYAGFVPPRAPEQVAAALCRMFLADDAAELRRHFLASFTEAQHVAMLRDALVSLDPTPQPA